MIRVTCRHRISTAHRLYDYSGSCERLHGHNYGIEITLSADNLDSQGMILDFSIIKKILLSKVDEIWDHRTLLYVIDPLCAQLTNILNDGSVCPVSFNPTAENMARFLGEEFFPPLLAAYANGLRVIDVTIFETENNSASWTCCEHPAG